MTHQDVANFAESWGLAFLALLFFIALGYALWPGNRKTFSRAAHRPLDPE